MSSTASFILPAPANKEETHHLRRHRPRWAGADLTNWQWWKAEDQRERKVMCATESERLGARYRRIAGAVHEHCNESGQARRETKRNRITDVFSYLPHAADWFQARRCHRESILGRLPSAWEDREATPPPRTIDREVTPVEREDAREAI